MWRRPTSDRVADLSQTFSDHMETRLYVKLKSNGMPCIIKWTFTTEFSGKTVALMLKNCGLELIFQPLYSPEFNSCEFCFRSMKEFETT